MAKNLVLSARFARKDYVIMEDENPDARNVAAKIAVNMGFGWIVLYVEGVVDVSMA